MLLLIYSQFILFYLFHVIKCLHSDIQLMQQYMASNVLVTNVLDPLSTHWHFANTRL